MTGKQNRWMLACILVLTVFAAYTTFNKKIRTYYGLDIQGGVRVVLRPDITDYTKQNKRWTDGDLESVRHIMENRVNFTGVSEPVIITKPPANGDPGQIIVELPGLKNEQEALQRIQSTASLEFYLLRQCGTEEQPGKWRAFEETDPKTGAKVDTLRDVATNQPVSDAELQAEVFSQPPVVTGKDLLPNSKAEINPTKSSAEVAFEFDSEGSKIFEEVTRANGGRFLAIFLDKKLLSAPVIRGPIPGKGIIEGSFTLEAAKALSDLLNAGALPVPLVNEHTQKLEATLGREAVKATTIAGVFGLILVLGFMLFWYRLPGVLANVALLLYACFSIAIFKIIPITLTLPGIAGFILSIGMAVDANILIFERMREELRSGKTLRLGIDAGFKRAFTAILDSNVCTMLTCFVLYNFGTGPIRGFALTLGLGVAISMFTAITVTRTLLFSLVGQEWAQNPAFFGVEHQWIPNLHVMRRKFQWLGLSCLVIVPGVLFWGMGGIKRSIDFTGGTELDVPFATRHSADEIQRALGRLDRKYRDSRVVVTDDSGVAKVAYITTVRLNDAERQQVVSALIANVGPLAAGTTTTDVGYDNVSGTISSELMWQAIEAIVVASMLIVLYLAIRFAIGGFFEGLKYGTCAVIALLHDVLVVWGSFAMLGYFLNWQVDSLFVTAMLTVIGFSVHDTIIVFDRIRENLQHRIKGESFSDVTDRSINQTFSRSLKTSFTVILTLLSLFLAGGTGIHQFSAALLIGIVSGTYSSIFNASVLLVMWKDRDQAAAFAASGRPQSTVRPGDRPLVAPKVEASSSAGDSDGESNGAARSSVTGGAAGRTRRPPARRRRM